MRVPTCRPLAMVALILLGGLRLANAAEPDPPGPGTEALAVLSDATRQVAGALGAAWDSLGSLVTPAPPYTVLPDQLSADDRIFFAVLETAGLRLGDVIMSSGLLSHATYRFVASPADLDTAEHRLQTYRDTADGLRARAKQRIARSVIDINRNPNFSLATVELDLWPWPSARFAAMAREAGK